MTLLSLLSTSAGVGLVVLALWLLGRCLDARYAARWKYWVWLVLAVRLVLPWNILPNAAIRVPQHTANTALVQTPLPAAPETTSPAAPTPPTSPAPAPVLPDPADLLAALWLTGAAAVLGVQLAGYLRARRRLLRNAQYPQDGPAAEALHLLEPSGRVRLAVCPAADSPLLLGFVHPVLVLPEQSFTRQELDFILRHELCHYRRRDLWYKLLLALACSLHWFNPLVWWMSRQASADLELSCDDRVVRDLSIPSRRAYAETILSCIRPGSAPAALSTAFQGGKPALRRRFANLFDTRKKAAGWGALAVLAVCAVLAGALLGREKSTQLHFAQSPDRPAFTLSVPLPAGWTAEPEEGGYVLLENGEQRGRINAYSFNWFPWQGDEEQAIYSVMYTMSSTDWKNEYTPVVQTETFGTATCRPVVVQDDNHNAVLAHSTDLLTYVVVWMDEVLPSGRLRRMAEEIAMMPDQPVEQQYTPQQAAETLGEYVRGVDTTNGYVRRNSQGIQEYVIEDVGFTAYMPLQNNPFKCIYVKVGNTDIKVVMGEVDSAAEALDLLEENIQVKDGKVRMLIPRAYPHPENWNIQITGRAEQDGMSMSLHFLEEVNEQRSWTPGNRYNFTIPETCTELTMYVELEGEERTIDLLALQKPSASDGQTPEDGITAQPDFLTNEQMEAYEQAENVRSMLFVDAVNLQFFYNWYFWSGETVKVEQEDGSFDYYEGTQIPWEQFHADMLKIFTANCFDRINNEGGTPRFLAAEDGTVLCRSGSRGTRIDFQKLLGYRLVSQSANRVEFELVALYDNSDTAAENAVGAQLSFPVRLVNTEDGWRVDEFSSYL